MRKIAEISGIVRKNASMRNYAEGILSQSREENNVVGFFQKHKKNCGYCAEIMRKKCGKMQTAFIKDSLGYNFKTKIKSWCFWYCHFLV